MKTLKSILLIIFSLYSISNAQIIADHTVVDKYDDIPQQWIDSVKTKLVWIMGMSHGYGYFRGVELLELIDNRFQAEIWYHVSPPSFTSSYMRLGRPGWGAEGDFYTNSTAISNMKSNILTQITNNNPYDIIAFGWSYQGTWHNDPGGIKDPVYNVRWAGSSVFGPDGDQRWGLDSGDSILTGNRVCMDTYLAAMEEYRQYCLLNDYPTKMLFTNGVVDENSGTESGYQRELKNQHIREYAQGKDGIYFLDYADILVYNSNGERYTVNWDDGGTLRPHDQIHPDNMQNLDASFYTGNDVPDPIMDDHIGDVGALRLGKALWWILARMAGWDGGELQSSFNNNEAVKDNGISIYSDGENIWINVAEFYLGKYLELYRLDGFLIRKLELTKTTEQISDTPVPGMYIIIINRNGNKEIEKFMFL